MKAWSSEMIGSLENKTAVVTGGTDGIGIEIARSLARAGARVVIAADHTEKGKRAGQEIRGSYPPAKVEFDRLDTSDLASVSTFVRRLNERFDAIDILVNNAGISGVTRRLATLDGFELTFATNYLGHFALTAQLLPLLLNATDARVVNMSSLEHKRGELKFEDLQHEVGYDADTVYAQSKLAILVFALELHRRARAADVPLLSFGVHPGIVNTNIFNNGMMLSGASGIKTLIMNALLKTVGQSAETGALPALFAATSLNATSGEYYGPTGFQELWGPPGNASTSNTARDAKLAERLWEISETLTGTRFSFQKGAVSAQGQAHRKRRSHHVSRPRESQLDRPI